MMHSQAIRSAGRQLRSLSTHSRASATNWNLAAGSALAAGAAVGLVASGAETEGTGDRINFLSDRIGQLEALVTAKEAAKAEAIETAKDAAKGPPSADDLKAFELLKNLAASKGLDVSGGNVRRTSSRFCLGVEHGDYNGTELFGVGTDRFIWMAYKPNGTNKVRMFSNNFPSDGLLEFELGKQPPAKSEEVVNTWFRFPWGTDFILQREGFEINQGFDAVVYGNIPGGGMSRSASLSVNLLLTFLEVNNQSVEKEFDVVELTQAVENDYVGSPCGQLDQIMIYFAKAGMGTHFDPATNNIKYVPLGAGAEDFCIVGLDTGTDRPGLDKSTYKVRREECDTFGALLKDKGYIQKPFLAEVQDEALYKKILADFGTSHPDHCKRLTYIYNSQISFYKMLEAWKDGDIATVGKIFREDGIGLRDEYVISGEHDSPCGVFLFATI